MDSASRRIEDQPIESASTDEGAVSAAGIPEGAGQGSPTIGDEGAEAESFRANIEKARRLVALELDLAETRRQLAENNLTITEAQLALAEQEIDELKAENERLRREIEALRGE
jgi:chemotaxis protein histidine kinase CheA